LLLDTSDMEAESAPVAPAKGGRKVRLMCLADLDGRTKARKAADKLLSDLVSDMGGAAQVSAGRMALAEHAAVLDAMAKHQGALFLRGDPIDVSEYGTLTNALRRLLETIGLERRAKDITPSLSNYLASKAEQVR